MDFKAPIVGNVAFGSNWQRRKQTLAMFSCSLYFIMPMAMNCWGLVLLSLFKPMAALVVACYLGYIFLLDKAPVNGTRRPWLRGYRSWWNHSCDYLPLMLVKTADLDPKGKYVMGYHPHGVISVGCFGAFATDGARTKSLLTHKPADKHLNETDSIRGFSNLFPGIDRRVVTLPQNFMTPFLREYFLSMGAVTSAKETFRNILAQDGGKAVVVVVGGAAESMIGHVGSIDLLLSHRRGFVREAIMANASLVPMIGFGENDIYETFEAKDHWVKTLQAFAKKTTGMAMPIFKGRSILFKDFGIMPQRKPVVVVVGAPIAPPKLDAGAAFHPEIDRKTDKAKNKDGEILKEWHAKYVSSLQELYSKHKDATWNFPGKSRRSSLKIR